jgi:hypothetical protein
MIVKPSYEEVVAKKGELSRCDGECSTLMQLTQFKQNPHPKRRKYPCLTTKM